MQKSSSRSLPPLSDQPQMCRDSYQQTLALLISIYGLWRENCVCDPSRENGNACLFEVIMWNETWNAGRRSTRRAKRRTKCRRWTSWRVGFMTTFHPTTSQLWFTETIGRSLSAFNSLKNWSTESVCEVEQWMSYEIWSEWVEFNAPLDTI